MKIYDSTNGTLLQTLPLKDGPVSLTFSSDAKTLLILDSHQTYTWFDVASGKVLKSWSTISLLISHLQGGGNNQFLESAMGSTLRVYDAQKGTAKYSLRNYKLSSQVFTPDGKWLVTADLQGVLSAYSTVNGTPGPKTSVGVLRGVGLMPGQSGSEVIVLAGEKVNGKQTHLTASAWQVGESKLTPRATAELASEQYAVMNQARTVLASLAACHAP